MAVANGAMAVAVMHAGLLDQRCVVTGVNARERNGIRRHRRTESESSESRCGQNRFHVSIS
jgi:hypothetical protein